MVNVSGVTTYNSRVDRAAYVARSVDASEKAAAAGIIHKPVTADELNAQLDAADLIYLKVARSRAAFARGETGTPIEQIKPDLSPEAVAIGSRMTAAHRSSTFQVATGGFAASPEDGNAMFTALNIDFVVKNVDKIAGMKGNDYSEFVKAETESLKSRYKNVIFTGTQGSDRVTHDVEEYVGWLDDAFVKRASLLAKTNKPNDVAEN